MAEAMSITRRPHEGENLMAIVFKLDSTTGEGTFIRVLRDGHPFGKILDAMGLYRFYEGDREKLGEGSRAERHTDRRDHESKRPDRPAAVA